MLKKNIISLITLLWLHYNFGDLQSDKYHLSPVKRICVFEHSVMTNFNCACPAIQRGLGSGFLSEGSSWLSACMSEQRRFWRDCADAQARLNLRCSHRRDKYQIRLLWPIFDSYANVSLFPWKKDVLSLPNVSPHSSLILNYWWIHYFVDYVCGNSWRNCRKCWKYNCKFERAAVSFIMPEACRKKNEPRHDKTCLREFPTRPDTNWPAQPRKLSRVLKFGYKI